MNVDAPVLAKGSHAPDQNQGCVMEWVAVKWFMRQGLDLRDAWSRLTDAPPCTDPMVTRAAWTVNDQLSDADRQRLVPLIDRLMLCRTPNDDVKAKRVRVRVACWAARSVLDLIRDETVRGVCERAVETAEAWLRGEASEEDCRAAAYAAAAYAAADAAYAAERDLVLWLDDLIDQWEKACAEEGALADEDGS